MSLKHTNTAHDEPPDCLIYSNEFKAFFPLNALSNRVPHVVRCVWRITSRLLYDMLEEGFIVQYIIRVFGERT